MHITAYVAIAAIISVTIYVLAKKLQRKKRKRPSKPGTIVLYQFPRCFTPRVISGSPPCLKLETFFRMTKLPYENDYSRTFSKKGKLPWIEFNGREKKSPILTSVFGFLRRNSNWMSILIWATQKGPLVTVFSPCWRKTLTGRWKRQVVVCTVTSTE